MARKSALDGIKVACIATVAAVPQVATRMGMWGATVVRIESTTRVDGARVQRPFLDKIPGLDRSQYYAQFSNSQMSVAINMYHPRGKEVAYRLIEWADVFLDGFATGVGAKLGLDYESVRQVKPDIIHLSANLGGQTGRYAIMKGWGYQATAIMGFNHMTGWPDRDPPYLWAHSDFIAPCLELTAVLAALEYRRRTGKGQYLDYTQMEGSGLFVAVPFLDYVANGRVWGRIGNHDHLHCPHSVYPCQGEDRWVSIAVTNSDEWLALCRVLGHPEWADDPRFSTIAARKEHEDELDDLISQWAQRYTAEEVMRTLQWAGVPAGVVQTNEDLFNDPQLKHRGYYRPLDHKLMGRWHYDGPSHKFSHTPDVQYGSPCLGEHNEHVYKEILGYSDEELANLIAEGVVQ